jgi:ABC-2 type transport system permease protein
MTLGALLGRSLARARALLLALAAVLVLFQVLVVVAAAYLEEQQGFSSFVAVLPPIAQQMMGGVFSSFGAMVAFGYFHPIVIFVFVGLAVIVASEPAADVESGVVDLILARPVRRGHLVSRSILMLVLTSVTIAGLMVVASWSAMRVLAPEGGGLGLQTLSKLALNLVALAWLLGTVSLAVSALARRRAAAAGTVGILALALYLLNFLAEIWPRLHPYGPFSPFHYYQPMDIVTGLGAQWAGDVLMLAGIGAAFCALAYGAFARRDV